MKLSTKIIILIATGLVLTSTLIGLVSTWKTYQTGSETVAQIERLGRDSLQRIKADGDREAVAFREELLALKKEYLKSEVQTAMSILEAVGKEPALSPRISRKSRRPRQGPPLRSREQGLLLDQRPAPHHGDASLQA